MLAVATRRKLDHALMTSTWTYMLAHACGDATPSAIAGGRSW